MAVLALTPWAATNAAKTGPADAQIAAIVVTANQVDIDAGHLAAERTRSADVKALAERMVIDKTPIPSAQSAELKDLLVEVRPAFEAHLAHARHVQAGLHAQSGE